MLEPRLEAFPVRIEQQSVFPLRTIETSDGDGDGDGFRYLLAAAVDPQRAIERSPERNGIRFRRRRRSNFVDSTRSLSGRRVPTGDTAHEIEPGRTGIIRFFSAVIRQTELEPRVAITDQEDIFRVDPVTAERASGVRVEPRVNALYVESVFAFRQQPQDFRRFEPRQAHGALQPFLVTAQCTEPENR